MNVKWNTEENTFIFHIMVISYRREPLDAVHLQPTYLEIIGGGLCSAILGLI